MFSDPNDNVIILGAGASWNANVPLMADFVQKMWEINTKGKVNNTKLSDKDKEVFKNAIQVRQELNEYHGRASFDDRNIEDILSLLSFNILAGKTNDKKMLNWIIQAMARTIELSCNVVHNGELNRIQNNDPNIYKFFWQKLFEWASNRNAPVPTIITFNYDLVLERSLLQLLVNTIYSISGNKVFPYDGIQVRYYYDKLPNYTYKIRYTAYDAYDGPTWSQIPGTELIRVEENQLGQIAPVEILKLHGSLNFPGKKNHPAHKGNITEALENPFILPPLFNKITSGSGEEVWGVALQRLRRVKNIIFVGYSLPRTDIYMQYFLKAALGPNVDLNRIYIFDPVLFKGGRVTEEMKERFLSCFSQPIKDRICFTPRSEGVAEGKAGTFEHFAGIMTQGDFLF